MLRASFMPVVVSSTLPCLGAARPGRHFVPPKATRALDDEDEDESPAPTVVCGYRIGPLVARGGLSVLFQVTHPAHAGALVMKVVTDERLQHDLAAGTIFAHARAIAALPSEHVVRTVDAGRLPSGEPASRATARRASRACSTCARRSRCWRPTT